MGQLIITTNISLDGVVEDPDGQRGLRPRRLVRPVRRARPRTVGEPQTKEALGAAALLLGRRSDEWFATRWASRTGEWADRLNGLPKYVVSATRGPVVERNGPRRRACAVAGLKREVDGEILVYASYQLGQALMEHDLVDELRLVVFPVVLGAGRRLFGPTSGAKALRLVGVQTIGNGLVHVTYQRAG